MITTKSNPSACFSLVEVTLALGIAAFALLAIFGLLAAGEQVNRTAFEQTAAGDVLTAVAADLRATPKTLPPGGATPSAQFNIPIPANPVSSPGPAPAILYFNTYGLSSTSRDSQSRYRLTVTYLPNGAGTRAATLLDLKMTWPAAADPTSANTGIAETFLALDRN